MKTKLDIYKDAAALALRLTGETDTMKIDGAVWDEAEVRGHIGKDFDQFKVDFRNLRTTYASLMRQPAPSAANTRPGAKQAPYAKQTLPVPPVVAPKPTAQPAK